MTTKTKHTFPTCQRDGFPMVKVNGRLQCAAEYLDRCIGQKEVVDVLQRGQTAYYVFEDGHELPLLCFCCGSPLVIQNPEQFRSQILNRRLEGMSLNDATLEDGTTMLQFELNFSKRWLSSSGLVDAVSPLVAVHLRHPASCPRRRQRTSQGRKA